MDLAFATLRDKHSLGLSFLGMENGAGQLIIFISINAFFGVGFSNRFVWNQKQMDQQYDYRVYITLRGCRKY